jgi:hypothetical protein
LVERHRDLPGEPGHRSRSAHEREEAAEERAERARERAARAREQYDAHEGAERDRYADEASTHEREQEAGE